jgi:hypothetical protein
MAIRVNHQDIVKRVLESKAVDFAAIGRTLAEIGPSLAMADEPWEGWCGTMRGFIRIHILSWPGSGVTNVEDLGGLRGAAGELER